MKMHAPVDQWMHELHRRTLDKARTRVEGMLGFLRGFLSSFSSLPFSASLLCIVECALLRHRERWTAETSSKGFTVAPSPFEGVPRQWCGPRVASGFAVFPNRGRLATQGRSLVGFARKAVDPIKGAAAEDIPRLVWC